MSPLFHSSKTRNNKHKQNGQRGSFKRSSLKKNISVFFFVVLFFMAGFYLFQINDLAIKGFEIRNLEKTIKNFQESKKDLEVKATELQSLSNIEEVKKELKMIKSEKIEYISPVSGTAKR